MEKRSLNPVEREALTALVVRHQGRVRAFLCRFERDPELVDQLTQDVFVGVLPRCQELAGQTDDEIGKYLRGVARHLVRLRWRTLAHDRTRALLAPHLEADLDREPDDTADRVRWLRDCLKRLGDRAQDLVTRHFFEGTPLARIAEAANESGASIRMTMLRIRRQLRECVAGHRREEAAR
jgi:RNA polymerase sigma-70 factor (ECF subfamily)